ncbi:MAG TPA: hypothetical protein VGK00_05340 [Anaerolineales bacterium]
MKKIISFLLFAIITGLLLAACTTENTKHNEEPSMPQPQVRVGALPTVTAAPPNPMEMAAPSPAASSTATPALYYIEPTPDEDAIANQIQALMDEIDRKLQSEKFIFNP